MRMRRCDGDDSVGIGDFRGDVMGDFVGDVLGDVVGDCMDGSRWIVLSGPSLRADWKVLRRFTINDRACT
jgi:hypothetical protein